MSLIERYRSRKQMRRTRREARLLLREARRATNRHSHRVTAAELGAVNEAAAEVEVRLKGSNEEKLSQALATLDKRMDESFPFARKSTGREYMESIAVAILIALFLRAFVMEAFKIPSGSMIPTLQVGDHIFVNKFLYGVRIPFTNIKLGMNYRKPRRGEVIVFMYPVEPDKDFIKRIVAVEGDEVELRENVVYVNGKPVPREPISGECRYEDYEEKRDHWEERECEAFSETVKGNRYSVIQEKDAPLQKFAPHKVPPRSVFVMGDNRDNSNDSRFWGTVPEELIRGKAMVIWLSLHLPGGDQVHGTGELLWRYLTSVRPERMFQLVH
jgi:signal peptidase I